MSCIIIIDCCCIIVVVIVIIIIVIIIVITNLVLQIFIIKVYYLSFLSFFFLKINVGLLTNSKHLY